jgi:oligoribonuclease
MPELEAYVHYRNVDVSSIKELVRRWYPRVYFQAPAKNGNHRALADIQESIEELRYYRETVFVPPPGPASAVAKEIAARHQGALTKAPDEETLTGNR